MTRTYKKSGFDFHHVEISGLTAGTEYEVQCGPCAGVGAACTAWPPRNFTAPPVALLPDGMATGRQAGQQAGEWRVMMFGDMGVSQYAKDTVHSMTASMQADGGYELVVHNGDLRCGAARPTPAI